MMRGMYWGGNERKGRGYMGGGENKEEKKIIINKEYLYVGGGKKRQKKEKEQRKGIYNGQRGRVRRKMGKIGILGVVKEINK